MATHLNPDHFPGARSAAASTSFRLTEDELTRVILDRQTKNFSPSLGSTSWNPLFRGNTQLFTDETEQIDKRRRLSPQELTFRGTDSGGEPLFSLPNQGLADSIHAVHHRRNSTGGGNSPQVTFPFLSRNDRQPSNRISSNTVAPLPVGSSTDGILPKKAIDQTDLETPKENPSNTNTNQPKETEKKRSYAMAGRFAMGKPTFQAKRNVPATLYSSAPRAMFFEISELEDVPSNVIMAAVNLQIGSELQGADFRYSAGKRSHVEVVFFREENLETWTSKSIKIINKEILGIKALKEDRQYLTVTISGIPLLDAEDITSQLKDAFGELGKIAVIKPKVWEGTNLVSKTWTVTFDCTDLENRDELTSKLPRMLEIQREKAYVTWKAAPKFCLFCKQPGHFKAACQDLKEARSSLLKMKNLTPSSTAKSQEPKGKDPAETDEKKVSEEEKGKKKRKKPRKKSEKQKEKDRLWREKKTAEWNEKKRLEAVKEGADDQLEELDPSNIQPQMDLEDPQVNSNSTEGEQSGTTQDDQAPMEEDMREQENEEEWKTVEERRKKNKLVAKTPVSATKKRVPYTKPSESTRSKTAAAKNSYEALTSQ